MAGVVLLAIRYHKMNWQTVALNGGADHPLETVSLATDPLLRVAHRVGDSLGIIAELLPVVHLRCGCDRPVIVSPDQERLRQRPLPSLQFGPAPGQ